MVTMETNLKAAKVSSKVNIHGGLPVNQSSPRKKEKLESWTGKAPSPFGLLHFFKLFVFPSLLKVDLEAPYGS